MHCPSCGGNWLPPDEYETWQGRQPERVPEPLLGNLSIDYEADPLDAKGGLCPDCHGFLSRTRIALKNSFYVERCPRCGGVWCDRGEWEVLEQLGLHTTIERLFSNDWQVRVREMEYVDRERRATIEKLGEDLAGRVFELAELLEEHPNGDFGVAYLMRRFEK